jgi:hypothetical protein
VPTVTADPMEEAALRGLTLDPEMHVLVPTGEFVTALKKAAKLPNLFVYFHRMTGNFVVADWLNPPAPHRAGVALELEAYPLHPDDMNLDFEELLTRLTLTFREQKAHMRRKLERASKDRRLTLEHELEERRQVTKWLRGQGNIQTADAIDTGAMPWIGHAKGGENLERTKRELVDMLKKGML